MIEFAASSNSLTGLKKKKKMLTAWTSLLVQRQGLCAPSTGGPFLSLET